jgi:hypothetical protein
VILIGGEWPDHSARLTGSAGTLCGRVKGFAEVRWSDLVAVFVGIVVLLMTINAIRGEPALSSTAVVSLPLAAVLVALVLAYAKRREHRRRPGGARR